MELVEEFASMLLNISCNSCVFYDTEEKTIYAMEQEDIDKMIYDLLDEFKEKYKSNN